MSVGQGRVQRAAYRVWLAVGAIVLAWVAWRVLARPVAVILPPLLLTTVIVYILAPIVSALSDRGLPRWLGTLLAYLGGLATTGLIVAVLVPMINEQFRVFVENLPELVNELGATVNRRLAPLDVHLPIGEAIDGDALSTNIERALEGGGLAAVAGVIGGLSGLAVGLLQVAIVFVLGPVIAFYLLVDLPRLGRWVRSLIPPRHRDEVIEVAVRLHHVVGGFIRGQLLVALFVGVATSIGLAVVGLPFWLLIGVIAGLTNLIPLLGPLVAGALGASIALVSDGVGLALLVVVVMVVVQQVDNHVVSPLVMGRHVQVHPLVVLLALLVAGAVYGLLGMLIAVPLVAAGNVLASHIWQTRVPWAHDSDAPPPGDGPGMSPEAMSGMTSPDAVDEPPGTPRVPIKPRSG